MPQMEESENWLDQFNTDLYNMRLEKDTHKIKETCIRAQGLLDLVTEQKLPPTELVTMAQEMLALDREAASWRESPEWAYKILQRSATLHLEAAAVPYPDFIELHTDVWNAYEWNYHRTARIIFHQQLLKCLQSALEAPNLDTHASSSIWDMIEHSISTIHQLADGILGTIPQSFGEIDNLAHVHDIATGPPKCRAIGSYLLLWPIKIIKAGEAWTSTAQKVQAQMAFEKIREHTGMKSLLGDKSSI